MMNSGFFQNCALRSVTATVVPGALRWLSNRHPRPFAVDGSGPFGSSPISDWATRSTHSGKLATRRW